MRDSFITYSVEPLLSITAVLNPALSIEDHHGPMFQNIATNKSASCSVLALAHPPWFNDLKSNGVCQVGK